MFTCASASTSPFCGGECTALIRQQLHAGTGGDVAGTLELNNLRLQTILFKCAVELNMLCHTIAAHFRADPIHTRELRAYAVDEVKRTNGQVSYESAVRSQRRIEPDDTWPGSY